MTEAAPEQSDRTPPVSPGPEFEREIATFLSAVGFVCAGALEWVHLRAYQAPGAASFCSVGSSLDCNTVALSPWSVVLGIPLPVWGMAGFLALGLTAWWRSRVFLYLSGAAAAGSVILLAIELLAIHSVCLLCEGVHLVSWILFAFAWRGRAALVRTEGMTLVHLFTVPVGILLESYFITTPYWALFSAQHGVNLPHGVDATGHPWIGAEHPGVVVDEYVDYSCPHCAIVASNMRTFLAKHASTLRVVRHQYSHMRCPYSPAAPYCEFVRAAACADEQGKLWEMDAWLFQHAPGKANLDYREAVTSLGLDAVKFSECLPSERVFSRVDAEFVEASRAKLVGTPAYFLGGKQYNGGTILDELKKRL